MSNNSIAPSLLNTPARIDPNIIPRWLVENYQGMDADIASWYTSYYFWRKWDGQETSLEEAVVKARANAMAKWETLKQTGILKGATDRSLYFQLYDAHQTGWFRYVNEIEDVRELIEHMLSDEIERDPQGGQRYELEFILKTMMPTMEKLGVPKEQIFGIIPNISKAKAAVPVIRKLVQSDGDVTDEIMNVFSEIANVNVSVREFKANNAERMGKTTPATPKPVPGGIYLIPGSELIVIESDRQHTNAIQMALRGVVEDLGIKDGGSLLRWLSQKILPKSNNFQQMLLKYEKAVGSEPLETVPVLVKGANGFPLPTPDDVASFAFQEAARSKFYIDRLLSGDSIAVVPAYTITGAATSIDELINWLMEKFHIPRNTKPDCVLKDFSSACDGYYQKLHPDLASLYEGCSFWLETLYSEKWGLFVGLVVSRRD